MSLTSMGFIYDDSENRQYSIWRVRNSTNNPANVQLLAVGVGTLITTLSVPANTDVFVRSATVAGVASHILTNQTSGGSSTKAANSQSFSNATTMTCIQ